MGELRGTEIPQFLRAHDVRHKSRVIRGEVRQHGTLPRGSKVLRLQRITV